MVVSGATSSHGVRAGEYGHDVFHVTHDLVRDTGSGQANRALILSRNLVYQKERRRLHACEMRCLGYELQTVPLLLK